MLYISLISLKLYFINFETKGKINKKRVLLQKEDRDFFLNLEKKSLNKLNKVQTYLGDNYNLEDMDIESPKVATNDLMKSFNNSFQMNNYFGDGKQNPFLSQPLSQNFNVNNMFSSEFAQRTAFAAMFNPGLIQTFNNMWFNELKSSFQSNQATMNFDNNSSNNSFQSKQHDTNLPYSGFQAQVKNLIFNSFFSIGK